MVEDLLLLFCCCWEYLVVSIVAATKLQDVTPSQYWPGTVVTFVEKSNGERIGEKYHSFYGSASGTDSYYDPSTWSKYRAGASTCAEVLALKVERVTVA